MLFIKKKRISHALTMLFCENAAQFNGLYNSIDRILSGENKKSFKALDEFYERISFIDGYEQLSELLKKTYSASNLTPKKINELRKIVLKALKCACIYHTNKNDITVLTRDTVLHYQDWDGKELYIDTKVKIIFPAWYQHNCLIEKGYCSIIE